MRDKKRFAVAALSGAALLFAAGTGGAIGLLAEGRPPRRDVSWQPPTVTIETRAAPEPATLVAASRPEPSPEPTAQSAPSPTVEPSAVTIVEPTPSPSLEPLVVETPVATAAPAAGPFIEYLVEPGDILTRIALRFGVTVDAIVELNPEIDPDSLTVGERLLIPRE